MTDFLSSGERLRLKPAERLRAEGPVPTQDVSNGEYFPGKRTPAQKRCAKRIDELAAAYGARQGMDRRQFLRSALGMAAAFLAMNEVYGWHFAVSPTEAADPERAAERAGELAGQFVFDDHTHFLRDDTRLKGLVGIRRWTAEMGKDPGMDPDQQSLADLKFESYVQEVFLGSDTSVALLSGAPSERPEDWFLTNDQMAAARERVNELAGSRRLLAHAVFTPGMDGWLEDLDYAIEHLGPDSWKGYTIGDNTHKDLAEHPWRMDDPELTYPGYERMAAAGINKVCVHKGLFPPSAARRWPGLTEYARVDDVGPAARDWPGLTFVIYHAGYRHLGASPQRALAEFERTGRIQWVSDLAEIPEGYGVDNVYADLGATFAHAAVTHPRLAAAILGILIRGLGPSQVLWGTDSVWFGSPQWQIEALRRLEIPEDLRARHGFDPLGPADGPVKRAILGENGARLYGLDSGAERSPVPEDRLAGLRKRYRQGGERRPHRVYGLVRRG